MQVKENTEMGVAMSREVETITGKPCRSCSRILTPEVRVCACGELTDAATFKERAEFEVKQWREYKSRVTAESA
jgi:uncharacterized OB-fold protein